MHVWMMYCLSVLAVDKLHEFSGRVLSPLHPAHFVWLVQETKWTRGGAARVPTKSKHQVQKVRFIVRITAANTCHQQKMESKQQQSFQMFISNISEQYFCMLSYKSEIILIHNTRVNVNIWLTNLLLSFVLSFQWWAAERLSTWKEGFSHWLHPLSCTYRSFETGDWT